MARRKKTKSGMFDGLIQIDHSRALRSLPEHLHRAVALRVDQLRVKQIAIRLGTRTDQIRALLAEALDVLQDDTIGGRDVRLGRRFLRERLMTAERLDRAREGATSIETTEVHAAPERRGPAGVRLTVEVGEFVDRDGLERGLVQLYRALSDLHEAQGGSGLKLVEKRMDVGVHTDVPEPVK